MSVSTPLTHLTTPQGARPTAPPSCSLTPQDFIQAKLDFVDDMLAFSGATHDGRRPRRILDVGCGIGGTTRHLASLFPDAEVVGVTLSPKQVARATELAKQRGLANVTFRVMDALDMAFEDGEFDLVWGCESGEHMPDKGRYVDEMNRVLSPGGNLVIACWCQREEGDRPFDDHDRACLQFLYDEWAHPFFISKEEFGRLVTNSSGGSFDRVDVADWTEQTIDSWRHSIWVGVFDPWIVIWKGLRRGPWVWWMVVREIVTLERMHRAFARGLLEYGMVSATKARSFPADAASEGAPALSSGGFFDSTSVEVDSLSWSGETTVAAPAPVAAPEPSTPAPASSSGGFFDSTSVEVDSLSWSGETKR